MKNAANYPSCIKIPSASSKETTSNAMFPQKFDVNEALTINSELVSLANRIFGEGKWSHTVTNQTIDFVESFMGKYICGCATFVKIQLEDGTFHEDMGYCHTETARKGLSIHCARTGSLTDAFRKVLSCFGDTIKSEVQKVLKKQSNFPANNAQKDNLQLSLFSEELNMLEPCAQSTPLLIHKNDEHRENSENVCRSKSPQDQGQTLDKQVIVKLEKKSSVEQKSKASSKVINQLPSNGTSHQNGTDNLNKGSEQKKVLPEEEFLRMERKRKQMEKQAEFKRLMKEKEQQKAGEDRKPNSRY